MGPVCGSHLIVFEKILLGARWWEVGVLQDFEPEGDNEQSCIAQSE